MGVGSVGADASRFTERAAVLGSELREAIEVRPIALTLTRQALSAAGHDIDGSERSTEFTDTDRRALERYLENHLTQVPEDQWDAQDPEAIMVALRREIANHARQQVRQTEARTLTRNRGRDLIDPAYWDTPEPARSSGPLFPTEQAEIDLAVYALSVGANPAFVSMNGVLDDSEQDLLEQLHTQMGYVHPTRVLDAAAATKLEEDGRSFEARLQLLSEADRADFADQRTAKGPSKNLDEALAWRIRNTWDKRF